MLLYLKPGGIHVFPRDDCLKLIFSVRSMNAICVVSHNEHLSCGSCFFFLGILMSNQITGNCVLGGFRFHKFGGCQITLISTLKDPFI